MERAYIILIKTDKFIDIVLKVLNPIKYLKGGVLASINILNKIKGLRSFLNIKEAFPPLRACVNIDTEIANLKKLAYG